LELPSGGVDFLGLRQANLDLMATCLPGINNVTRFLRPFALLSWVHWKYHQLALAAGQQTGSSGELHAFLERAEILFTWGHKLNNLQGIPGLDASAPTASSEGIELSFKAWKRIYASTGLMAALWYGPGSKSPDGLGFLEPVAAGLFRACGQGVTMAEALEARIRERRAAQILGLKGTRAQEADAKELFEAWSVDSVTQAEKDAFRAALYGERWITERSGRGKRSATLALILDVLAWARTPLTAPEIRRAMATRRRTGLPALAVRQELHEARMRWIVLQVRQLQRLALEGLFAWTEGWLVRARDRGLEQLGQAAATALRSGVSPVDTDRSVQQLMSGRFVDLPDIETAFEVAEDRPDLCVFRTIESLASALKAPTDAVVRTCFDALLLCGHVAELMCRDPFAGSSLRCGSHLRISLQTWVEILRRSRSSSCRDLLVFVIENLVLSQHFSVATSRYDGQTQRLRIALEEDGLVALVKKPWQPNITRDRLETALRLMAECGMIVRSGGDKYRRA